MASIELSASCGCCHEKRFFVADEERYRAWCGDASLTGRDLLEGGEYADDADLCGMIDGACEKCRLARARLVLYEGPPLWQTKHWLWGKYARL